MLFVWVQLLSILKLVFSSSDDDDDYGDENEGKDEDSMSRRVVHLLRG